MKKGMKMLRIGMRTDFATDGLDLLHAVFYLDGANDRV